MWQKIKKFFKVLFATKMELILEDRTVRLFVNDEIVPLQIVYSGEFLVEQPESFGERLVNELRRVTKAKTMFILVRPLFLVILKGKPETVNSEIIFKIITNGIQCRELFIIRWSEAEKHIGKNLEQACREFPRWLKDLRFVKNVQA
jgi:hypothetical protein